MADESKRDGGAVDIVAEAKVRFERAKDAYTDNRQLAIADTQFVMGDSDNKWQWPQQLIAARGIEDRPMLTVNVTAQHCNQIINNIRQNRPQCKVSPTDGKADKKTAEILAGLIRNIQAASYADVAHDTAAEHMIYGGEGYWFLATDYESPKSFNQVIKIKEIQNPQLVFVDPFSVNPMDKAWGFIFEDITKEECKRDYPETDPATWGGDTTGWASDKTVRIANYYYRENVKDTLYLLADGSTILESEAAAQGEEVLAQVKANAAALEAQQGGKASRPTMRWQWKYCKLVGCHDKPLEVKDWPGSYLPIISVIGKELNVNGKVIRKGVVRDLKDPARIVNYSYSGAVETIALQNKIPYIGAAEAIEGFEDQWKNANQSTASILTYNQYDEAGQKLDKPERQQPAVMPQAQVTMLQLSTEQMRAASGQQNSNFGIKSEAQSGIGIQRLKVQGETATFHFPDNLTRALHYEAVCLIDLICGGKVLDTKRIVRILGIDGKEDQAMLDPGLNGAYHEITAQDVKRVFNPTVGQYDVAIDTGPSYQTQRAEAAAALTELTTKNPDIMAKAGDIVMKAYDFPFSEQLADRLKPPGIDEQKGIPPEVQQQMQQMQMHIQSMGEALNNAAAQVDKLEADNKAAKDKLEVDAYGKLTERLKVLLPLLTPEEINALALETTRQALQEPDPLPDAGAEVRAQIMRPPPPPQGDQQQEQEPASAGFFMPEGAATGAQPGPGAEPVLPEGNPQ